MRPIYITGIPGSGKTSLAQAIAPRLGYALLTMHDLVERIDPDSLSRGDMADENKMRAAYVQAIADYPDGRVVVDGWPRTPGQAALLPDNAQVFLLNCRTDIAVDRLLRRGRADDRADVVIRRVTEQADLLGVSYAEGWAIQLSGWDQAINTSLKTAEQVAAGVMAYLRGKKRQAFDHDSTVLEQYRQGAFDE